MKKRLFKLLSVAVSICLLIAAFSGLSANAKDSTLQTEPSLEKSISLEDVAAGLATPEELYGEIAPETVPAAVGLDVARERTHVRRLYEDEGDSLNQVVFQNADGTKTLYYFDHPVKYVNKAGKTSDISLDIVMDNAKSGHFTNAAHSLNTTFSKQAADGIKLTDGNVAISLIPLEPSTTSEGVVALQSTASQVDAKTVAYTYNNKTSLEYSLTYKGFKEDIVVKEYTGQTEYSFKLLTGGLTLTNIKGSYYLMDLLGNLRASIGDIIIFTADERNNAFGRLSFKTVKARQEYILTIHLDEEYLKDENTVYPIKIDPTIELNYDNYGTGAIHDVTLNSLNISNTASTSLSVGRRSDTWGISRILMAFPELDLSSISSAAHITAATVELRDILCEAEALTVECREFIGGSWDENFINWAAIWGSDTDITTKMGPVLSTHSISYSNGTQQASSHRYAFNITSLVRAWKLSSTLTPNGIIFKATDNVETGTTVICKTVGSYNRSSYRPALYVTYAETLDSGLHLQGNYYINNVNSGYYMHWGNYICGVRGTVTSIGGNSVWRIEQIGDAYVIRNSSNQSQVIGTSTDPQAIGVQRKILSDGNVPDNCLWYITLAQGGGCLIRNKCTGKYMYSSSNSVYTTNTLGNSASYAEYTPKAWRVISTTQLNSTIELGSVDFYGRDVIKNQTVNIKHRTSPTNAIWCQPEDFIYSVNNSSIATITYDGKITGVSIGTTTITVKHKPTDKEASFTVYVADPKNYVGNLTSWNDIERNAIAYWNKDTIKVYIENSANNAGVYNACNTAISQWEDALQIQIIVVNQEEQADIEIYIDTANELSLNSRPESERFDFSDSMLGQTYPYYDDTNNYSTYNGNKIAVSVMEHARIGIATDRANTTYKQIWTAVHEFGHALGYLGHSMYSSDIMYYCFLASAPVTSPSDRDIAHLKQVYDLMN